MEVDLRATYVESSPAEIDSEIARFARSLVSQMAERLDVIEAGALGNRLVDLVSLREQHAARVRQLEGALDGPHAAADDWERIECALRTIDAALGA